MLAAVVAAVARLAPVLALLGRPRLAPRLALGRRRLRLRPPAEDHLARRRLQHARHRDLDRAADRALALVHHDHRPVVEVGDALAGLLALLEHEDAQHLARQHHRLQRVRELVDVEHGDAAQLGHLVEVEVVGDDLAGEALGELDQLEVDLAAPPGSRSPRSAPARSSSSGSAAGRRGRAGRGCASASPRSRPPAAARAARTAGTTSVPSRKPVSQMSAMRPSMITEVSSTLYWCRREASLNAAMIRAGSNHSPRRAPITTPM